MMTENAPCHEEGHSEDRFEKNATPSFGDSSDLPDEPWTPALFECPHGVASELDERGDWGDPSALCDACVEDDLQAEWASEEIDPTSVEGSEQEPIAPVVKLRVARVDVDGVTPDPIAWEEVRSRVECDPSWGTLTPEEQGDARLLANLSIAELAGRIDKALRLNGPEMEVCRQLFSLAAAHLAHLANHRSSGPFVTYKGSPWWFNPSCVVIGKTGAGKGTALAIFRQRIGTDSPTAGLRVRDVGRVTHQGLVGTVRRVEMKKRGRVEAVPGALEDLADGIALVDEFTGVLQPEGSEPNQLQQLLDLLWKGELPIHLAAGKRTATTWSIVFGAIQTHFWDPGMMLQKGLHRRFWIMLLPEVEPEAAAREIEQSSENRVADPIATMILRAKFAALQDGLSRVHEMDLVDLLRWFADEVRKESVDRAEMAVYVAFAVGDWLCCLRNFSPLRGTVTVPLSEDTIRALEGQTETRRLLLVPKEEEARDAVLCLVEQRLSDGAPATLVDLSVDVAARLHVHPKAARAMLLRLILDPSKSGEADDGQPLLKLTPTEAYNWAIARQLRLPLPPGRGGNNSPRVVLRSAVARLGFDEWHTAALKQAADSRRASLPRPWRNQR